MMAAQWKMVVKDAAGAAFEEAAAVDEYNGGGQ
jgi:hypothetical protein